MGTRLRCPSLVESVRQSWFDTCAMSESDRIKIDRTNVQKSLQPLKTHRYQCCGVYVPVTSCFGIEVRCPIEEEQ